VTGGGGGPICPVYAAGVSERPLVTLTVWGVPARRVPSAVSRMALDRPHLGRAAGLRFAKLLGTGHGRTFTVRDADWRHWGLLAVWDGPDHAEAFRSGPTHRRWAALATETLQVRMRPLASKGLWSGRTPFGDPVPVRGEGPVAALTRARLRPSRALRFWRAVPSVSADLHESPGLCLAIGVGEVPIGLQGTFSLWDSAEHLTVFAYRRPAHRAVVDRTAAEGWYAEELFARFAVESVIGTLGGRAPLAGRFGTAS
jgi:hypothetical protein